MNNKIVAVIVTYNRLELLKEAIQAVKAQTELPKKVIIVNNNSTDDTKEYLESIKSELITPVHLEENLGGAGGFYHGIKKAYNEEADWVWIMDDDTIATPTALEKLVNCLISGSEFVSTTITFDKTSARPPFPSTRLIKRLRAISLISL